MILKLWCGGCCYLSPCLGSPDDRESRLLLLLLARCKLCRPQLLGLRNKLQLLASKLTAGKLAAGKSLGCLSLRPRCKPAVKLGKWVTSSWLLLLLLLLELRRNAELLWLLLESSWLLLEGSRLLLEGSRLLLEGT